MTICVAAIGDNASAVVVASDRMISAGFLALEFEHPDSKIDALSDTCVGLTAGDALVNTELFRACRRSVGALREPSTELISSQVGEQFAALRRKRAEERVLAPRGLTMQRFYEAGLISQMPMELALTLDRQIQEARYPLVDAGDAHIYGIDDPGTVACYDRLGYHAIGSGETHALVSIVAAEHSISRDLNQTVFSVYEAKRRAEVAQGVGASTELAIVSAEGTRPLSEHEKNELEDIYAHRVAPQTDDVMTAIAGLPFGRGG